MRRFLNYVAHDEPPPLEPGDPALIPPSPSSSPTPSPTSSPTSSSPAPAPPPSSPLSLSINGHRSPHVTSSHYGTFASTSTIPLTSLSSPSRTLPPLLPLHPLHPKPPPSPSASQAAAAEVTLRRIVASLSHFADPATTNATSRAPSSLPVMSALRHLAHSMVWADQHYHALWDLFMELSVMPLLFRCLQATLTLVDIHHQHPAPKLSSSSPLPPLAQSPSSTSPKQPSLQTSQSTPIDPISAVPSSDAHAHAHAVVVATDVQSQVLQTLSIMVQSVSRKHSLFCLFSADHINHILSFPYVFASDEMLGYLMSTLKTISLKLDPTLLQLFFHPDPDPQSFVLYETLVPFHNHHDPMVRIAVRNVVLTLCALNEPSVLHYIIRDDTHYLRDSAALLKRLCGGAARALELLLDDGFEVRRTRSRTGIFRRTVRISDVEDKLQEISDLVAYFGDVASLSDLLLKPVVFKLLASEVFAPLFRPLASYASPLAVRLSRRRQWPLTGAASSSSSTTTTTTTDETAMQEPALAMFDAGARMLLIVFVVSASEGSTVGEAVVAELCRPSLRFENRHVVHGLKAIAGDVEGTERMTFMALLTIGTLVKCGAWSGKEMESLGLGLGNGTAGREDEEDVAMGSVDFSADRRLESRDSDLMMMTLKEFDSSSSRPTTPVANGTGTRSDSSSLLFSTPSTPTLMSPRMLLLRTLSSSTSLDEGVVTSSWKGSSLRKTDRALATGLVTGTGSLRDVLWTVVVGEGRRREVRTQRTMESVVEMVWEVAKGTGDWCGCMEFCRVVLDDLACGLKLLVKSRDTRIVAIETSFDHLRAVSDAWREDADDEDVDNGDVDVDDGDVDEEARRRRRREREGGGEGGGGGGRRMMRRRRMRMRMRSGGGRVTTRDVIEMATEMPRGAGRRRRGGGGMEVEEAEALFAMMEGYEGCKVGVDEEKEEKEKGKEKGKGPRMEEVVQALLEDWGNGNEESYLDKRDALERMADAILRHADDMP